MRTAEVLNETLFVGLPWFWDEVARGDVNGANDRFDVRDRRRPDIAALVELGSDEVGEGGVSVDRNGKLRRDVRSRDGGNFSVEAAAETRDQIWVCGKKTSF
jgi:hypothetical protein